MHKSNVSNWDHIPERLLCSCEIKEPKFLNTMILDWRILGMGFICIYCGRYADKIVYEYTEHMRKSLSKARKT